jgi:hypothetical protein
VALLRNMSGTADCRSSHACEAAAFFLFSMKKENEELEM